MKKIIVPLALFLSAIIAVLVLLSNCILYVSAEEINTDANTYTLCITVRFADKEEGETTADLFKDILFVIRDTKTQEYLQAVYDEVSQSFIFTGFTSEKGSPRSSISGGDIVTHFCAGMSSTDPNSLVVTNIPKGEYIIINYDVPVTYDALTGTLSLQFTEEYALLNDNVVQYTQDGNTVEFSFTCDHGEEYYQDISRLEEGRKTKGIIIALVLVIVVEFGIIIRLAKKRSH